MPEDAEVRVAYASDLHTEFMGSGDGGRKARRALAAAFGSQADDDPPHAVALAGDLGSPACAAHLEAYRAALEFFVERQRDAGRVLVVTGNHEYYYRPTRAEARARAGLDRDELAASAGIRAASGDATAWVSHVDDLVRDECARASRTAGQVAFLQAGASAPVSAGVRAIGATLWTDVPAAHEAEVARGMNDHAGAIPFGFGVADARALHRAHAAGLRASLDAAAADGDAAVVVTHHAPRIDLLTPATERVPFYGDPARLAREEALDSAYACRSLDVAAPVPHAAARAWIHGHAHGRSVADDFGTGVVFARDPLGYPGELRAGRWRQGLPEVSVTITRTCPCPRGSRRTCAAAPTRVSTPTRA